MGLQIAFGAGPKNCLVGGICGSVGSDELPEIQQLIRRRVFRALHHENLDELLLGLELQAQLVHGGEQGGPGIRPFKCVIVEPVEPGLIHDWTTQSISEHIH